MVFKTYFWIKNSELFGIAEKKSPVINEAGTISDYLLFFAVRSDKSGKLGILTPITKCGLLGAKAPKPPNRRINPAAALFSKCLCTKHEIWRVL